MSEDRDWVATDYKDTGRRLTGRPETSALFTHYTGSQQVQLICLPFWSNSRTHHVWRTLRWLSPLLHTRTSIHRVHINKIATASGTASNATLTQNANFWLLASNLYRSTASSKTEWGAATPFTSRYRITFHPRPVRMELCLRHWPYSGDVNVVSQFIYRMLKLCDSVLWGVPGVGAVRTMLLNSNETAQWGKWLLVPFVTSYSVEQIKHDEIDGCGSQNKQRLCPYTTLTDWFVFTRRRVFTARYGLVGI
jgi:hypothetical protein